MVTLEASFLWVLLASRACIHKTLRTLFLQALLRIREDGVQYGESGNFSVLQCQRRK